MENEWTGDDDTRVEMPFTMSTKVKELLERVGEVAAEPRPILPGEIQRHLGSLLAAAYTQDDTERCAIDRFAELLAKLNVALGEAVSRDDAAFKKLLVAAVPVLRRFAVSLARDPTAADDMVQDTLMRAWKSRARFKQGTNFDAWTFTILRNNFYSSQRRQREVQDEDGSYTARLTTLPDQASRLDLQDVRAALDRLAPVMRETLILVAIESLSYDEVAAIMNCQVGTVKSRVWRARDQLARALGYSGSEIGNDGVMLSALSGSGGGIE